MTAWIEPIGYINEEVPDEAVSIQGHVVQKWKAETPIKQVGLFGDPTGSLRFVQWDDIHEIPQLVVGGEYLIETVRAQSHKGKVSVVFTDETQVQRLSNERNPRILRDIIYPDAKPDTQPESPPISFQSLRPKPNRTIEVNGLSQASPPWDVPLAVTLTDESPRLSRVTREGAHIEYKYRLSNTDEEHYPSIRDFESLEQCVTTDGSHEWGNEKRTASYFVLHHVVPLAGSSSTGDELAEQLSKSLDTTVSISRQQESSPLYSRGRAIAAQHEGISSVEVHSTSEGDQIRLWCDGIIPHRILPRVRDTVRDHGEYITKITDRHRGSRIDLTRNTGV